MNNILEEVKNLWAAALVFHDLFHPDFGPNWPMLNLFFWLVEFGFYTLIIACVWAGWPVIRRNIANFGKPKAAVDMESLRRQLMQLHLVKTRLGDDVRMHAFGKYGEMTPELLPWPPPEAPMPEPEPEFDPKTEFIGPNGKVYRLALDKHGNVTDQPILAKDKRKPVIKGSKSAEPG
jgi:hypothetical protein